MEPQAKRLALQQPGVAGPSSSSIPLLVPKTEPGVVKPIDRVHTDAVLNFLLRLACQVLRINLLNITLFVKLINRVLQVNDASSTNAANSAITSPGELLSRRCVILLKTALKPDVWPQPPDLKLVFFDKILLSVDSANPNIMNICTALELLTFLLGVMTREQILVNFKQLQAGLGEYLLCLNYFKKIIGVFYRCLHYF